MGSCCVSKNNVDCDVVTDKNIPEPITNNKSGTRNDQYLEAEDTNILAQSTNNVDLMSTLEKNQRNDDCNTEQNVERFEEKDEKAESKVEEKVNESTGEKDEPIRYMGFPSETEFEFPDGGMLSRISLLSPERGRLR